MNFAGGAMKVPRNDTCSYKFLVIDNQDLLENNNLERKTNQAVKHPEPVMRLDAPWDSPTDCFNFLNVIYDEQEETFKCGTASRPTRPVGAQQRQVGLRHQPGRHPLGAADSPPGRAQRVQ